MASGWVPRKADPADKRRKLLWTTPEGEKVALGMKRVVARVQHQILEPLNAVEREQLLALLAKLVAGHENSAA